MIAHPVPAAEWVERRIGIFDHLASLAADLLDVPMAVVSVRAGDRLHFVGRHGIPDEHARVEEMALADSLCRFVFERGCAVAVADARVDPLCQTAPAVSRHGVVAYLGHPIRDEDGTLVGSFALVSPEPREWTEREDRALARIAKVAEAELAGARQAERVKLVEDARDAALRDLRLLRHAVSRLNDLVIICEAEPINNNGPRVVFVNEAFERRTGYSRDEIIGRTPRLLQGPDSDRATLDRIRAALEQWQPIREEIVNYTKTGEKFWLELDIVPVADSTGWYTHWIAVERDITERKRLESELRQAQRLEAIGQFSGGIAHDFANIAAIIATSSALLAERLGPDPDLQAIRSAADRARSLVSQILAFSRRQVLNVRSVSLTDFMHQTESLLRRLVHEDIVVDVAVAPDAPAVLVDETQLVQVLLNLVGNASDAMPEGGHLRVAVSRGLSATGEYGRIEIADTGVGIDVAHLPHIFEPFFTTKPKGQGTGLGLSTVYGIVQQLGGEVRVRSELGRGTVFEIDLPCAAESCPASAVSPTVREQRDAVLHGLHVVLVEDEDALRRATQRLLQRYGMRVDAAVNGYEALTLVRESSSPPDLVLSDLVMPGLGGRAMAEALREIRPGVPVVFMSGYDQSAASSTVDQLPAAGYLQKPFDLEELLDVIAATVVEARTARQRAA